MRRRLKKKDHENLSDTNIRKVRDLLNGESPISKKEACGILNISYNTTRLQKIIDDYEDKVAYREQRKKQNRGKRASDAEVREAIERFLSGDSISEIASGLFRSPAFVKGIIERVGVPQKTDERVDYLPDECLSEDFSEGELVWSARYSKPAIVKNEVSVDYQAERAGYADVNYEKKYSSKCYAIWVIEPIDQNREDMFFSAQMGGFNAYQAAYDLGKLSHLEKYGVALGRLKNNP